MKSTTVSIKVGKLCLSGDLEQNAGMEILLLVLQLNFTPSISRENKMLPIPYINRKIRYVLVLTFKLQTL